MSNVCTYQDLSSLDSLALLMSFVDCVVSCFITCTVQCSFMFRVPCVVPERQSKFFFDHFVDLKELTVRHSFLVLVSSVLLQN